MDTSRRSFLAAVMAAAGGRAAAKPLDLPIGIQPYTVRKEMEADFEGTLRKLVAIGYEAVEVGDPFYGRKPEAVRDLFQSLGLKSSSGFFPYPKDNSAWAASIEHARTLGVAHMITTVPEDWTKSLDGWKRAAERLNQLGAECKKAGMAVAYHNHNFEFKTFDGVVAYDELLRLTDAETVKMEMDCFWTTYAGKDPVEYFHKHPGRFALLHIKDLKKGFTPSTDWPKGNPFTEVGAGVIDYKRIFKAAPEAGLKQYYVEQDNWDRPPLEAARISCEYLKNLNP
jgi:sugar phosphate isomerase/epimerase